MLSIIKEFQSHIKENILGFEHSLDLLKQLKDKSPRRTIPTINKLINLTINAEEAEGLDSSLLHSKYEDLLYDLTVQTVGKQADKVTEDVEAEEYEISDKLVEEVDDPDFENTLLSRLPIKDPIDKRFDFTPLIKKEIKEEPEVISTEDDTLIVNSIKHFSVEIPRFVQKKDIMYWKTSVYVMCYLQDLFNHFSVKYDTIYPGHIAYKQLVVSIDKSKFKFSDDEDYRPIPKFVEEVEKSLLSKLKKSFNQRFYIFWFNSKTFKKQIFGWCVPVSWMKYRAVTPEYLSFPFDCKAIKNEANIQELREKRLERDKKLKDLFDEYTIARNRREAAESSLDEVESNFNTCTNSILDLKKQVILSVKERRENQEEHSRLVALQMLLSSTIYSKKKEVAILQVDEDIKWDKYKQFKKEIKGK